MIVIASCTAINLTLPIWLYLAKINDDKKFLGHTGTMEDSDNESESNNEENSEESDTIISKSILGAERNHGSQMSRVSSSIMSDSQYSMSSSTIGSQISSAILEARRRKPGRADRSRKRRRKQQERDIRLAVAMQNSKLAVEGFNRLEMADSTDVSFSTAVSVMSKLSVNDVSMNDRVSEKERARKMVHGIEFSNEKRSCCQAVLEVSEWDSSLASLTFFYMVQGLVQKIVAIVNLAIISHAIGITEANAYIMVTFLFEVTGVFVVGFEEGKVESLTEHHVKDFGGSYFLMW